MPDHRLSEEPSVRPSAEAFYGLAFHVQVALTPPSSALHSPTGPVFTGYPAYLADAEVRASQGVTIWIV